MGADELVEELWCRGVRVPVVAAHVLKEGACVPAGSDGGRVEVLLQGGIGGHVCPEHGAAVCGRPMVDCIAVDTRAECLGQFREITGGCRDVLDDVGERP